MGWYVVFNATLSAVRANGTNLRFLKKLPPKAPAERMVKDIRRATRRHVSAEDKMSDNRPSYIAGELAEYIEARKMSHVRGAPMHPQTQGKIER